MKKITNGAELKDAIFELELKKVNEGLAMKEQFSILKESLKPANLIKSTIKEVASSPSAKTKVLTSLAGIVAGYLAKKAIIGSSIHPIRKVAGTLLQIAVAGGAHGVKSLGSKLLKRLFNRSKNELPEINHEVSVQVQDNSF